MSDKPRQILLDILRHGEPEGGEILRGRIDPPLTERGWQQMRHATGLQPDTPHIPPWDSIISSPLQRCSAFAKVAAEQLGLSGTLQIDENWAEIDYGDWDGMPLAEWRVAAASQFKAFRNDLTALQPPNGEAYTDFRDRVLSAWERLMTLPNGSHVLLVTHGGVMRVILPTVLGMPLNASFPLHIPFATISRIQLTVGPRSASATLLFHNGAEFPLVQKE